jgi:hypothetical protein
MSVRALGIKVPFSKKNSGNEFSLKSQNIYEGSKNEKTLIF